MNNNYNNNKNINKTNNKSNSYNRNNSNNKVTPKTKANKAWSPKPEKQNTNNNHGHYNMTNMTNKINGNNALKNTLKNNGPYNKPNSKRNFMQNMKKTVESHYNMRYTENGAIGYSTSGNKLVDMNYAITSMRNYAEQNIADKFCEVFAENPVYAMRWLGWVCDVREGAGERRLLRAIIHDMAKYGGADIVKAIIPMIPEYSRWDNLWCLFDTPCKGAVIACVKAQMEKDNANYLSNKPISLMAKWMPSENTSSKETTKEANILMKGLKMKPKQYRTWLSKMRKYIDVVERKMSSNNWQSIDYETVPSKANLIYNKAFLKHDADRRTAYLNALTKGEAKINSSTAFPYEIVHRYGGYYINPRNIDEALEGMWKSLPNTVKGNETTMVVCDGSGSMQQPVSKSTKATALEVAYSLAIYFAERANGAYHNQYITFSSNPQYVDLTDCNTLHDKIIEAKKHSECSNTNIEKVFDLILETAVKNHLSQDELPQNILIISDGEFDDMTYQYISCNRGGRMSIHADTALFEAIADKYSNYGYKLPKLIFWNVCSRTMTIPLTENENGVILVSGFSTSTVNVVLSGELDPLNAILSVINNKRYDPMEKAVKKCMLKRAANNS